MSHLVSMTAQDDHTSIILHLRFCRNQLIAGIDEILHTLVGIGDTLTNKKNKPFIDRQSLSLAGLLATARTEDAHINGVGNTRYGLSTQQRAALCLLLQPFAAGHESDITCAQHRL